MRQKAPRFLRLHIAMWAATDARNRGKFTCVNFHVLLRFPPLLTDDNWQYNELASCSLEVVWRRGRVERLQKCECAWVSKRESLGCCELWRRVACFLQRKLQQIFYFTLIPSAPFLNSFVSISFLLSFFHLKFSLLSPPWPGLAAALSQPISLTDRQMLKGSSVFCSKLLFQYSRLTSFIL